MFGEEPRAGSLARAASLSSSSASADATAPANGKRSDLVALVGLIGIKSAVSALVLASGFRALSDDDYARLVIAQQFAAAPSLDPSGTSWLPAPFWLNGTVLLIFDNSVSVAQGCALLQGLAATGLLYIAARWLDLGRTTAFVGAALAAAFPYSAWLGVAAVPEALTAALIVLAGASLHAQGRRPVLVRTRATERGTSRGEHGLAGAIWERRLLWAAGALFLAAASRYEAWPVAIFFGVWCLLLARANRSLPALAAAFGALLMPVLWIAHGVFRHDDAWFFVHRVSEYERALGAARSLLERLVSFPLALLRCEPEVVASVVLGVVAQRFAQLPRARLGAFTPLGLAMVALLLFLVLGDLRGGTPTHHRERAVLALWYAACLLAAALWQPLLRAERRRPQLLAGALAVMLLCALTLRPWFARRDDFIDRRAELAAGELAASLVPLGSKILIDGNDYGFYASIAAFRRPALAAPFDDHDPRKPRSNAFGSAAALRRAAAQGGARWFIVADAHAHIAAEVAARRGQVSGFGIYELL